MKQGSVMRNLAMLLDTVLRRLPEHSAARVLVFSPYTIFFSTITPTNSDLLALA